MSMVKMNNTKSQRAPNFTNSEKSHLLRIIANKYGSILEDKKTDRVSATQKESAWQAIENEFIASSSCTTFRNSSCLKKCYENRKKELRKAVAEERKKTLLTGGGPPPKIKKDESDDILRAILNEKTLVGLHNRFDDDGDVSAIEEFTNKDSDAIEIEYIYETGDIAEKEMSTEVLQSTNTVTKESNDETTIQVGSSTTKTSLATNVNTANNNWKKYTAEKLQTPTSDPLRFTKTVTESGASSGNNKTPKKSTSRRRPTTIIKAMTSSDIANKRLLDKRLHLVDGQLKHMEAENALVIKKLELETEILRNELGRKKQNN